MCTNWLQPCPNFAALWTVSQASQSMGFSRQEYWSGLPLPPPGDLPHPGFKPTSLMSLALASGFFTISDTWEALSSVQFSCSVVSNSLRPHESQHARPACPSSSPGVHSNSHPSSCSLIQTSHPRSSPFLPAPNTSQHQSLFQWVNSLHEVAKVLEFQL